MRRKLFLGLILSCVTAAPAQGAAWGVSDTADTPVGQACPGFTGCSLRQAVTSTELNPGPDAILVSAGTYVLTNGQLTVTQELNVSRVGAGAATISGNDDSRIFDITGGDFVLRFLALTAGLADGGNGGAVLGAPGTTISVESTTISNSHATGPTSVRGGAIYSQGAVTLQAASGSTTGTTITGNTATATDASSDVRGGGVAVSGASLAIGARTTISGNDAVAGSPVSQVFGGGVYADGVTSLTGSTIANNDATGGTVVGGGLAHGGAGATTITRSTVSGNTVTGTLPAATIGGGGIGVTSTGTGDVSLLLSTIANNSATTSSPNIGTTVLGGGVARFGASGALDVRNTTVAGNATSAAAGSTALGGGLHMASGFATVSGSIVAENTQGSGVSQCNGGTVSSGGYNLLGDISTCAYSAGTGDVTGVTDAGITALGDFGGLTETRMLELGSPALDLIPANALCTDALTDQRGISRPQAGNCDAGAVEALPATLSIVPDPRIFPLAGLSGSSTANVSISNAGDLAMASAPSPSVAAPFAWDSGCTSPVAAGSNCILSLRFTPTATGDVSRTLTVTSGPLSDTSTLSGTGWGNTVPPALTGAASPLFGDVLGADDGTWSTTPDSTARDWQRCDADGISNCAAIPSETAPTYAAAADDVGKTVRVRVVATNGSIDEPAFSAASGVVGFANTAPPAITGGAAPLVGVALSADDGTWDVSPDSYAREWLRCDADGVSNCAAIGGATSATYSPDAADVGHTVRARVTATASDVSAAPATSSPSGVVGFVNVTLPAITDGAAPKVGDALTVSDGAWTASPDGYAREWQSCDADGVSNCTAIPGASGTIYTATAGDVGRRLRVRVVATRSGVSAEPAFTTASAVVAAAPSGGSDGSGGSGGDLPGGSSAFFQCDADVLVLHDVRRVAGRVRARGFAPARFAGQKVTVRAARGGGRATTVVGADGTFTATLDPPRGRRAGATRYTATLGELTSGSLRLDRRFVLLSTRSTPGGVAVRARVVDGRRGLRVTLRQQLPCIGSVTFRTVRLGARGILEVTLPRPTAAGAVALYRAYANLSRFPVWTLPIAVPAAR